MKYKDLVKMAKACELAGAVVIWCDSCKRWKDIQYPEDWEGGPSLSSDMFCQCNQRLSKKKPRDQ